MVLQVWLQIRSDISCQGCKPSPLEATPATGPYPAAVECDKLQASPQEGHGSVIRALLFSHVYGPGVFLNLCREWLRWTHGSQIKMTKYSSEAPLDPTQPFPRA